MSKLASRLHAPKYEKNYITTDSFLEEEGAICHFKAWEGVFGEFFFFPHASTPHLHK